MLLLVSFDFSYQVCLTTKETRINTQLLGLWLKLQSQFGQPVNYIPATTCFNTALLKIISIQHMLRRWIFKTDRYDMTLVDQYRLLDSWHFQNITYTEINQYDIKMINIDH